MKSSLNNSTDKSETGSEKKSGRWFVYFIPVILGIAFSIAIFFVVWNKSLHSNNQTFILETVEFRETVTRNLIAAENIAINIEAFLGLSQNEAGNVFSDYVSNIFNQHGFIEAVELQSLEEMSDYENENKAASVNTALFTRTDSINKFKRDISSDDFMTTYDSLKSGSEFAMLSLGSIDEQQYFWLYRLVHLHEADESSDSSHSSKQALLAILVRADALIEQQSLQQGVATSIYSESRGLAGRQLIYENQLTY